MLIAAAVIGALTAYYFGVRPGLVAAGIALAAFLAAMFIPGAMLPAYAFVGVGVLAICAAGPRFGGGGNKANLLKAARRAYKWLNRLRK